MAVNFLDEILVELNGTSSSKKYLQLNGGGGSGSVSGQAGVGFRPLNAGSNVHASIEALENGNASYQTNLTFNTNGSNSDSAPSERMRITSAGNVGIGTTGPSKKLDVNGDVTFGTGNKFQTIINALEGVGANGVYLRSAISSAANPSFSNSDDTNTGMFLPGSDVLGLSTAGSERLRITSAGNVGIGTTSPSEKLEVAGKVYIESQGVNWNETTPGLVRGALHFDPVGSGSDNTGNAITFGASDTSTGTNAQAGIYTRSDGSYGTKMYFATTDSYAAGSKTRMMIDENGNVGIGTTSPSQKLDVVGNIKTSGRVYINGTGNFIDTTRNASSQANYIRFYDSSTSSVEAYVGYTSNNRDFKINSANGNGTLTLQAGGGTAIYVDSSQKVGIGTTAPSQKLTVAGTIMSTASSNPTLILQDSTHSDITIKGDSGIFSVSNASVGQNITMLYNGNVGIGTTSPTRKLDVAGDIYTSERLYVGSNQYYVKLCVWNSATYGIGMTNGFTYGALNNDYAMTFCMNDDSDRGFWWGYSGQNKSTGAMSLNSEGKLKVNHSIGLGTANPSATQGRIDASNDIVAFSTSDIRLKDNIKSIDKALDKVNSIQGIEFDWIEKEEVHGNSGHDIGVIAQEIEKILPDVVTTRDNGYKAVKYEKIVPLLIEAIKDLSKQVDGLKRLI